MEGNDDDATLGLEVHVDDDEPTPWPNQGSAISPDTREPLARPWEILESAQRPRDTAVSVGSCRLPISARSSPRAWRVTSMAGIG